MVKKIKKRKARKKNIRSNEISKIDRDYTGLYVRIAYFVIGIVLYNFSKIGLYIFCGFVLLTIIKRISEDVI